MINNTLLDDIAFAIIKYVVGLIVLGVGKTIMDIKSMRMDLDIAFNKIRALQEKLDAQNNPPK